MSREEIRIAITELLEDTPDPVLVEVLNYLEFVKNNFPEKVNLRRILTEDKELLE